MEVKKIKRTVKEKFLIADKCGKVVKENALGIVIGGFVLKAIHSLINSNNDNKRR